MRIRSCGNFMSRRNKNEFYTGIEIGTSSVKVAIGEVSEDETLTVCGLAEESLPANKVVKGEIADADFVTERLARACSEAERLARRDIEHYFLAATGSHVESVNNSGRIRVDNRANRRITEEDVVSAGETARNYPLPMDKSLINAWDRRYVVDNSREVVNPSGLIGDMVEAEAHIIYGRLNNMMTGYQLVADLMNREPSGLFFSGIASGYALGAPSEMQRGLLVIDIGAGVTEYTVFHGPGVFCSGQITVGCQQIINDLSLGLRLSYAKCQHLLNELSDYGSAIAGLDSERTLDIEALGKVERRIPFSTVETVIEVRLREIFEIIRNKLNRQNALSRVGMGVILSGGGSLIPEIDTLARQILGMPAAVGCPRQLDATMDIAFSPRWAVPLGLVRLGAFSLEEESWNPSFWESFRNDMKKFSYLLAKIFRW